MRHVAVAFAILLTSVTAVAQDTAAKATEGYEWVRLQPLRAMFMKPVGWYFKTEQRGANQVFLITREDLTAKKQFVVGLTVTVLRPKTPAAEHASVTLDKLMATGELKKAWTETIGPMSGYGALVRRGSRPPVLVHVISLANPKSNCVYLISFEAPEAEWQSAWALGEPILKTFMLDEED